MSPFIGRFFLVLAMSAVALTFAASPPSLINYQGVLRDAEDKPLSGKYDMTFRFYDAATLGNEILVDSHTMGSGGMVKVEGGLFNVQLGSGTVTDGSGPGIYTSLDAVFRDFGEVHMAIQIGLETLSPRVRIVSSAYALNAGNLDGRAASDYINTSGTYQTKSGRLTCNAGIAGAGTAYGGYFRDSDGTGYGYVGYGDRGIEAHGNDVGGFFKDANESGYAYVGYADRGIVAHGNIAGAFFSDLDGAGSANIGTANRGIEATGSDAGGYFKDFDDSGYALIGFGNRGIHALGTEAGGYFKDSDHSGYALVGYIDRGIVAHGNVAGGYFSDLDGAGSASLGSNNYGIEASGSTAGGSFKDATDSGIAYAGYGNMGLYGTGSGSGVYGRDSDSSGFGYVGYADTGVVGHGTGIGGYFADDDSTSYGRVGYDTYKIQGNGTVSFVQNHPLDPGKVIVYSAPEGDETATYTRGIARLSNGEAHVALGETFTWVTNPDIGLTAYITPVGGWSDLYIAALSTRELVVRSHAGTGDTVFNYIVYGLRIGFEELSIVQEKQIESFIPSMAEHRKRFALHPELRRFAAQERHAAMRQQIGAPALTDGGGAAALKAAIGEYNPALHGPVTGLLGHAESGPIDMSLKEGPNSLHGADPPDTGKGVEISGVQPAPAASRSSIAADNKESETVTGAPQPLLAVLFPVSEAVEAGDLLTTDLERPGFLRRTILAGDPRVAGIAAGPAAEGTAPVAFGGVVICKVDAGYGAIVPGDLLSASPTPGHAMRTLHTEPGTIIGKALGALDAGRGMIQVLVMPR